MEVDKFSLRPEENTDPAGFLPEGSEALAKYIEEDLKLDSEDELTAGELNKRDYSVKYFLKAAEKGKTELVESLLENDSSLLNGKDADGYSAIHRASYNGHVDVVMVLLKHGADISSKTDNNWQPLHCACRWDHAIVASVLLQNGADINAQTSGGHTPLHLAALHCQDSSTLLEILLTNKHINAAIRNCQDETAFDLAKRKGKFEELFQLVEQSVVVQW